jgi:hypothetical protein
MSVKTSNEAWSTGTALESWMARAMLVFPELEAPLRTIAVGLDMATEPYFRLSIRAHAAAASRSTGWALIDSPTAAFIHDSG